MLGMGEGRVSSEWLDTPTRKLKTSFGGVLTGHGKQMLRTGEERVSGEQQKCSK
jgi:hypothetical protein